MIFINFWSDMGTSQIKDSLDIVISLTSRLLQRYISLQNTLRRAAEQP